MPSRRFPFRLKQARTVRGLSRRELSLAAGFSAAHVQHLEVGRSERVGLGDVEALAEVLLVDPAWLAFGTGDGGPTRGVAKAKRK
jgi:transcriptional regulator with XRE-family HTH domain